MKNILIIGAASAIAQETARIFAKEGYSFFLSDINDGRLSIVADDLKAYGATRVSYCAVDANDYEKHSDLLNKAIDYLGVIDKALIAYGTLPDQESARKNPELMLREFSTNGTSVISYATIISNYFEIIGSGTLAVISSVAGDRGRQSNYIYGAAKGAVSLFLQGLRNKLSDTDIKIITVKPGMVETPMTAHLPKSPLFSKPNIIAKGIYNAMMKGYDIVYLPGYWKIIMCIIKSIPESIFKKLKL